MIVAGGGAPGGGGGGGGSGASSAAAVASSSSESEDPTGTSSSSSASSSSSSSSFAQFAPLVDLEHSVADGTVLDLKHRLRTTERSHGLLQRQYEALQRKYHTEAAQAEEKCLRYCKQIDNLTAALEQLIEKNVDLGAEVAHERAEGGLARDRVADLEESLGTMRQLMMEYLSKPTAAAKRSAAEKEFWKKLATPEVLAQSRPPRSFPVRKAHPVHTMELTRVRGQLTLQQSENKRLRSKLAELMKANADLRSRHLESRKEAKQLVSEQSHQLVGPCGVSATCSTSTRTSPPPPTAARPTRAGSRPSFCARPPSSAARGPGPGPLSPTASIPAKRTAARRRLWVALVAAVMVVVL